MAFLRDAILLAEFALKLSGAISVRLAAESHQFPDGYVTVQGTKTLKVEVTEADHEDRRRGDEYKDAGKAKERPTDDSEGVNVIAKELERVIQKKARKRYNPKPTLVVWLNLDHLSRNEAAALLAGALGWDRKGRRHKTKINRHLARFILVALYTGTRHDAILRLQWMPNLVGGWIDLDSSVLYRRPAESVDSSKRRPPITYTSPPYASPAPMAPSYGKVCHRVGWKTYRLSRAPGMANGPRASRAGPGGHPSYPAAYLRHDAAATRRIGL